MAAKRKTATTTTAKKPARKTTKRDFSQIALGVVERVTGAKLK